MNFDPDLVLKYANFALSFLAIVYAWFATRRHWVDDRFKEGSKKFTALELRVELLESAVQSLPDKDDMHVLAISLTEMSGEMKAMRAVMRGMSESMARTELIVGRHEDHLLNGGKT